VSAVSDAIPGYLELRRAFGFKLAGHERLLESFAAYLDQQATPGITTEAALAWAALPQHAQPTRWNARLCVVRGFARYLATADPAVQVPPAGALPRRRRRPTPRVLTDAEITALLAAAGRNRWHLPAATYPAVFGLLAATGMRVSEVINLDDGDVDLEDGVLTIRDSKFGKSRHIPVHETTVAALREYCARRGQLCPRPATPALFVSAYGHRLAYPCVREQFATLTRLAGIGPRDGVRPRVHSLRHSFAVATLAGWYRDGIDVAPRLPLLSAYLGHVSPESTYWYLQAVPELLTLAAGRLDRDPGQAQ
jgi:integrase/recombinase XerD